MPSKNKHAKASGDSSRKQSIDESKKVKATKKVVVESSSDDSDSSVEQKAPVKRQERERGASNVSDNKKTQKVVAKVPAKK